ncbi:MAG TPA: hypothetical protein DEG06_05110 [Lachnospiraceae bacterium]|jgi:hypothetical protein|nr:hypothetical protein [Lachnospiraceae bacterium]HBY71603.1 hypothetical protein [Lachnospiraceae bacterium]HCA69356.1 hypothetical protein [Lachnospiraceae bacterium]HCM14037.1 hypothetical protein [Lachnospiraceae bacterium]
MKVNDLMTGRNQGMAMALKIVRDGGIEALEKEIEYRNLTGVSLNITRPELEQATTAIRLRATEVAIAISLITLLDEFCFSKYQARRYKEVFDQQVDRVLNDEVTLNDYLKRISRDLDIKMVIRD